MPTRDVHDAARPGGPVALIPCIAHGPSMNARNGGLVASWIQAMAAQFDRLYRIRGSALEVLLHAPFGWKRHGDEFPTGVAEDGPSPQDPLGLVRCSPYGPQHADWELDPIPWVKGDGDSVLLKPTDLYRAVWRDRLPLTRRAIVYISPPPMHAGVNTAAEVQKFLSPIAPRDTIAWDTLTPMQGQCPAVSVLYQQHSQGQRVGGQLGEPHWKHGRPWSTSTMLNGMVSEAARCFAVVAGGGRGEFARHPGANYALWQRTSEGPAGQRLPAAIDRIRAARKLWAEHGFVPVVDLNEASDDECREYFAPLDAVGADPVGGVGGADA